MSKIQEYNQNKIEEAKQLIEAGKCFEASLILMALNPSTKDHSDQIDRLMSEARKGW